MLLAIHQQSSVAGQAVSATRSAQRWQFPAPECINYSPLKTKVCVSDGQASDDGNVKILTVSIDASQAIAHSNLARDLTQGFTGYRCIPPEA
jgi:hypothetical protein